MTFEKDFFEDEVRDGFYVSGIMKRSWAAQLEVLEEIDKVCKKHGIKWFADCGTLIGAVRHGGVIPWDDDFDICMLREDYETFLSVAGDELPKDYLVRNMYTEEDYYEFTTRIVNGRHFSVEDAFLSKYHDFPFVVGIDIFVLDDIYQDDSKEAWRIEIAQKIQTLIDDVAENKISAKQLKKQMITLEKVCNYPIDPKNEPIISLYRMLDKLFAASKKEQAEDVALMPYWIENKSHRYPKHCFEYTVDMPFEGNCMPVPIGYDQILRTMYGDFMKMSKQGGVHDYPLFKAQEELLNRKLGRKLCGYSFQKSDTEWKRTYTRDEMKQCLLHGMNGLKTSNTWILDSSRQENKSDLLEILGECQNRAIALGSAIEQLSGEGTQTVRLLEEYCECVYQIYNAAVGTVGVSLEQMYEELAHAIVSVEVSLQEEILSKKEVLLIPYKSSNWESLKPVWKEAISDDSARVIVMPIPYYEKDALGNLRELHEEFMKYPEDVRTVDYRAYNMELRHPDVIVIQNPYDECNYVTSVPPEFYSSRLKKVTDELIYIPYFTMDEVQQGEEKALQSMEYFVTVPGLVHSDLVLVQSEQMKKEYINQLVKMAGESTRELWEKKLVAIQRDNSNCKSGITKEKGRKQIAYYVSISILYQYKGKAIEKCKKVFHEFAKHKEQIQIIWYMDEAIEKVLKQAEAEVYQKFREVIKLFYQLKLGKIENRGTQKVDLLLCDGYYGDASTLAKECIRNKIPVMIESIDV